MAKGTDQKTVDDEEEIDKKEMLPEENSDLVKLTELELMRNDISAMGSELKQREEPLLRHLCEGVCAGGEREGHPTLLQVLRQP